MGKPVQQNPIDCQSFPPALFRFVVHEAIEDADAVAQFLSMVEQRSGKRWERPVRFPAAFLFGTGVAIRLAVWESEGFFPHIAAGLPNSADAMRQVIDWCLSANQSERDSLVLDLASRVFQISVTQFAWEGPAILGGNVLLENDGEEDRLISAIAELAWKNRHKEFANDEPTEQD